MDPILGLTRLNNPDDTPVMPNTYKANQKEAIPRENIVSEMNVEDAAESIYIDKNKAITLDALKHQYETVPIKVFDTAKKIANPFEYLGTSIFNNRAAIKFANTDAIFNLTGQEYCSYITPVDTEGKLIFCDIAAGPGSFTEYIQWRKPLAVGYGMTLKGPLDWNMNIIDKERFFPVYGNDGSGNLYTQWEFFVNHVLKQCPAGVDLVSADGGFEVSDNKWHRQETLSSRLILAEALIAACVLKTGGNFVCKVFDTVTKVSRDTLYLLSRCFEKICMFKPVSSRPANSERYLVCINKLEDGKSNSGKRDDSLIPSQAINIMINGMKTHMDSTIASLLDDTSLPFDEWLLADNEISFDRQIVQANKIISLFGKNVRIEQEYNLNRVFKLLKLPKN